MLTPRAQLVLDVNVGRRDHDVQQRVGGRLQRLPGAVDLFALESAQRGDFHVAQLLRQQVDGLEVAWRRMGKAGLDDVDV